MFCTTVSMLLTLAKGWSDETLADATVDATGSTFPLFFDLLFDLFSSLFGLFRTGLVLKMLG